jgi:signal transduction histidine kinase
VRRAVAIPRSTNIKLVLFASALLIIVATLLYTRSIVQQLLDREHDVADLSAKSFEFIANNTSEQADYTFIFDEIIRTIDFPMILSDADNTPLRPFYSSVRNIALDSSGTTDAQEATLRSMITSLDGQNPPIRITVQGSVIQYLHYGESRLITTLRWLPYIEIAVAGMFILLGYIGFSTIKRNEQSNIWVGMAKETAHQLGTPLSSLMGWVEMMKIQAAGQEKQLTTIGEMENDLLRLGKVTERFSKIGSKPSLRQEPLNEVIQSVIDYFRRRLPGQTGAGGNIRISIETQEQFRAPINRELFEWVIENLIKNGLDAMEQHDGSITFCLESSGQFIMIDVRDTGKGIDMKDRKDIFRPGYSTKQRGWGLGLSLSKRIIETYHKGRLFVKESRPGKGTTFRIKLPA